MICVWIDDITPCLKDSFTGDIVETEVIRIRRSSFLKKFNESSGWYVNWSELAKENEIYALVIAGTVDIQGLVAIQQVADYRSVYVTWMVSAPGNNKEIVDVPRYLGVGGHLFAIAIHKSVEYGYDGVITGFAANEKLLDHYVDRFHALPVQILHPYHFVIEGEAAQEEVNTYDYTWTDDQL